jgi:hypothetical protein
MMGNGFSMAYDPDIFSYSALERRTKGGTTSYWMQTVRQSSSNLRELILGGTLHREKIIDGRLLDPYLNFSQPIPVAMFPRLIACISAEIWLRSWWNDRLRMARSLTSCVRVVCHTSDRRRPELKCLHRWRHY